MEKPRCSLKVIYSCFDCHFFQNRASNVDVKKEKYHCLIEKRDFAFDQMFPLGVPIWCPLPEIENIKKQPGFETFKKIFEKLDSDNKK